MQQILHSYQLRLTNLSQGNRALRLLRLSKRRDMDLCEFAGMEYPQAEELMKRLIADKDVKLVSKLDPRFAPTNLADRRLTQIFRTVNTLQEETGTHDLFVGYPFVEGRFLDGTIVRCPVLLFPVDLVRDLKKRPRWQLKVRDDEAVVFNKTFFLAYEHFQNLRLDPAFWEEEIDPSTDWHGWLNALFQKVKDYELEVNFNPRLFDLKLSPYPDMRKEETSRYKPGVLTFQPHAVLGIFPQSDSALLQDYDVLKEKTEEFSLSEWFQEAQPTDLQDTPYIKEEDRYFVTPVDQSQEEALLRVKSGQSLVLHGPPGTGKSQVIVNLIADAMAHGKKVLLVSQKRAALDVVYRRLQGLGLSRFSVLVHDYRHDRSEIYQQIKRQIDDIEHFKRELKDLNYTKEDHDYKQLSRQLDQYSREFQELYDALTQPQPCGWSVHEMYLAHDSQLDPLPLAELPRQWNRDQLEALCQKLQEVLDYKEFFEPGYAWHNRLSFKRFGLNEREQLRTLLMGLPEQMQQLKQQYDGLTDRLNTRLLEPQLNQERIQAFRQADSWLQKHQAREDFEALAGERLKPEKVLLDLDEWRETLARLDTRIYLDDGHWRLYESLYRHTTNYKNLKDKPLRILNLNWHQARWFLKKILQEKGKELDDTHFAQVRREVRTYRRLHQQYAKVHENRFYEDFPLLGTQQEKWDWLKRKQEHARAFTEVKEISYFRKIRPKFTHGSFDQAKWQQSMKAIGELDAFTEALQGNLDKWRAWLPQQLVQEIQENLKSPEELRGRFEALAGVLDRDFESLRELDTLLGSLNGQENQLVQLVSPHFFGEKSEEALIDHVRQSFLHHWLTQAEQAVPILSKVSGRGWYRRQRQFSNGIAERRTQVARLIRQRLKERIVGIIRYNRLKNPITYRSIYHQVSKKRRLWSVRKLVSETWRTGLSELVPCWMASPESVAAIFPLQKDFFDLVIFDEASQCLVERGLTVALRGKQAVIAGDDKQLRPSDLYRVRYEEDEAAFVENEQALEVESILDLAQNSLPESYLSWHYRSRQEALINFSNHAFYQGKLQVPPPSEPNKRYEPALRWVQVNGSWENNRNSEEADAVLDQVLKLLDTPHPPSMGIVTFNFPQQQLIADRIDLKLEEMARLGDPMYDRLQAALHRTDEGEYQGLFVKNIENVQGDERDIILFSVGYAKNERGVLSTNFGLLNQQGGQNRLNVAITRARQQIWVMCSFLPHELKVDNAANDGPRYFRDYLSYVKAVSDDQQQDALHLLDAQNSLDLTFHPQNPIADWLEAQLTERGYTVDRHVGDTAYKLDMAVRHDGNTEGYQLGISCEGSYYFSGESSKEREVYRPDYLAVRGWELYHVWARNFWRDKEKVLEEVIGRLG